MAAKELGRHGRRELKSGLKTDGGDAASAARPLVERTRDLPRQV